MQRPPAGKLSQTNGGSVLLLDLTAFGSSSTSRFHRSQEEVHPAWYRPGAFQARLSGTEKEEMDFPPNKGN